ncbi:hypothetical protein N7465_010024 [Penicillium sp. CMV-2018d]|nr:hypothetical protein N7465_010024 [Penicillium sp. CMV-2018d]
MKREKKCAKCGTTETKGHWHCAYDANGQKTGDDWCSVCAMKNKRDVDKAAKGNDTQTVHVHFAEGQTYLLGRLPQYACRVGKRESRTPSGIYTDVEGAEESRRGFINKFILLPFITHFTLWTGEFDKLPGAKPQIYALSCKSEVLSNTLQRLLTAVGR